MTVYEYSVFDSKGNEISLSNFQGKVIMIVNTATGCGFTPQYEAIESLYEKYHEKGLEIIDIPCNQFGNQAPGADEEIQSFCKLHYNTKFLQMKKSDVNGANELPLYTFLKSQKGFNGFSEHKLKSILENMLKKADENWDKNSDIKWNFTKFIIDRNGNVVARFEPTDSFELIENCVESLI